MSKTFLERKQPAKIDQFYAELFMAIARGMVTRPDDLEAAVIKMPCGPNKFEKEVLHQPINIGLQRYVVSAQGHTNDNGILIGAGGAHLDAFSKLLRAAAVKRGEFCGVQIEEGFGQRTARVPTANDPSWSLEHDVDVAEIVFATADGCWDGIIDAYPRSEGGKTIVTIETEVGIAEEDLIALQVLMKAYGRGVGRSILVEANKV